MTGQERNLSDNMVTTTVSTDTSSRTPVIPHGKKTSDTIMTAFIVLTLLIAGVVLALTAKSIFFSSDADARTMPTAAESFMGSRQSQMSFTPFDVELAKRFMDKDNDGTCDSCGMPVEMCIESGQLQCNMDSSSTMGILGSQHIHADWKIDINGKQLDLSDKDHMGRMGSGLTVSSFIHVDSGAPEPEKTGDVLHMHGTGIPLWIWFESVGMKFDKDCLEVGSGKKFCTDGANTLKFIVNGKLNSQYEQYVFHDLDKILISYGPQNENVDEQFASITNFALVHQPKTATPLTAAAMVSRSPASLPPVSSPSASSSPITIKLPANIQSSAPMKFSSVEEEIQYMTQNAQNPQNIDVEKAIRNMDANLDGVCDTCGMAILHCIEGGMEDM